MSLHSRLQKELAAIPDSPAHARLAALFDEGSFTELDAFAKNENDRVEVVCGFGAVFGSPVYAFAQDHAISGGAVGRAQAAKIKKVYDLAAKTGSPVVGIYDSDGAHLTEGMDALAAYGELLLSSNQLSGVVPQISVIAGPCGGTAAMVACSADFVVMSEQAELFLTPPAVLQEDRTDDCETATAQACQKAGTAHLIASDDLSAIAQARNLLARLPLNNLSTAPLAEFSEPTVSADTLRDAAEQIQQADSSAVILDGVADAGSVLALQEGFGSSAVTALAGINGSTVGLLVWNGGAIDADSCAKAARFVRMCDAFSLPVITFVHTKGFVKCATAENSGLLRQAAQLSHAYAEATTPKISVVTGSACGAAYIALAGRGANADLVLAWPGAEISALEPDAAISILWNDRLAAGESREALVAEYRSTVAAPYTAAASGQIDGVIDAADTRAKLIAALDVLVGKRISTMPKKHSNITL